MGESPRGTDKKPPVNHIQKTRFFLKPNLMQMHSSYVITDPKGTVLVECGKMLAKGTPKTKPKLNKNGDPIKNKKGETVTEIVRDKNGKIIYEPYRIKVLNTINFNKSMPCMVASIMASSLSLRPSSKLSTLRRIVLAAGLEAG